MVAPLPTISFRAFTRLPSLVSQCVFGIVKLYSTNTRKIISLFSVPSRSYFLPKQANTYNSNNPKICITCNNELQYRRAHNEPSST